MAERGGRCHRPAKGMITKLSDILPGVIERFRKRGWRVERPRDLFLRVNAAGEDHTLDGLERTGPVYRPHLKDWVGRCGEGRLILPAMGFFDREPRLGKLLGQLAREPFQVVVEEALAADLPALRGEALPSRCS